MFSRRMFPVFGNLRRLLQEYPPFHAFDYKNDSLRWYVSKIQEIFLY